MTLKRIGFVALVAGLALVGGTYAVLRAKLDPEALRQALVAGLASRFTGRVSVGSVTLVPFDTVRASDVRLCSPDGSRTYLSLGALDATVDLRSLFGPRPRVVSVLLDRLTVEVARLPDGTLDALQYVRGAPTPEGAPQAPAVALEVDTVEVRHGTAVYRSSDLALPDGLRVADLAGSGSLRGGVVTLRTATGTLTGGAEFDVAGTLRDPATLDLRGTLRARLEQLAAACPAATRPVAAGALSLAATVRGPLAAPVVEGTFTSPEATWGTGGGVVRDLSGEVRYAAGLVTLTKVVAKALGGTLEGGGAVDLRERAALDLRVVLRSQLEHLVALLPAASRPVASGPVSVDATVRGPLSAPVVEGSFTSPAATCGPHRVALGDLNGALRYAAGRATLSKLSVKAFGGAVSGSGSADLAALAPTYVLELGASAAQVPRLLTELGGPSGAAVAGTIQGVLGLALKASASGASPRGMTAAGTLGVGALSLEKVPGLVAAADQLGMPVLTSLHVPAFTAPVHVKDGELKLTTPQLALDQGLVAFPGEVRVRADGSLGGGLAVQVPWALLLQSPVLGAQLAGVIAANPLAAQLKLDPAALAPKLAGVPGPQLTLRLGGTLSAPTVERESAEKLAGHVADALKAALPTILQAQAKTRLLRLVTGAAPAPAAGAAPARASAMEGMLEGFLGGR